ncbi:hypothetical protein J6590_029751 [Homalodisca vitripennis]|nr:hypothetical protein J6590_029751 [Homalodisca vitripennis]
MLLTLTGKTAAVTRAALGDMSYLETPPSRDPPTAPLLINPIITIYSPETLLSPPRRGVTMN